MFLIAMAAAVLMVLPVQLAWAQQRDIGAEIRLMQERGRLIGEVDQLTFSGRHREALPRAERLLDVTRLSSGPGHADTAWALERLARVYEMLGRYAQSEPLLREAIRIHGQNHAAAQVQTAMKALAVALEAQGRRSEAAAFYVATAYPHVDPIAVASRLNYLAVIRDEQARFGEAEDMAKRTLELRQQFLGQEHADVGVTLNNLAMIRLHQGRQRDAEPLLTRALAIAERHAGPWSRDVGSIAGNLASIIDDPARGSEVEALFKRVIDISARGDGPDHRNTLIARNNLASFYRASGRLAEAEETQRGVIAALDASLARYRDNALARSFLGLSQLKARALMTMAGIRKAQGRIDEARDVLSEALRLEEESGPDHVGVETAAGRLGALELSAGRIVEAHRHLQRAAELAARRLVKAPGAALVDAETRGERMFETAALAAARRAGEIGEADARGLVEAAFRHMQWASRSAAAAAVAQLSARFAAGSDALAGLVRQRQDLAADLAGADNQLADALAQGRGSERMVADLRRRMRDLEMRIAELDSELARKFPDYAALTAPAPLSIADTQTLLAADEALLQVVSAEVASVALILTRERARAIVVPLGAAALADAVGALRCGLDAATWSGSGAKTCAGLLSRTGSTPPTEEEALPFDHGRAHALYLALLGGEADAIRGKHLLVVVSGPLAQLPLQVLVTKPVADVAADDPRRIAWLVRDHAVSVLPSVASLDVLRRLTRPSRASLPMAGFGNPLLDGPSDGSYAEEAALAREHGRCPAAGGGSPEASAASSVADGPLLRGSGLRGGSPPRQGLASVDHIRAQVPLPETADELCGVARDLGAAAGDIHLGADATERTVKDLSRTGDLARYRLLHFATHGVLPGQIGGSSEPGLILTPPVAATLDDDGFLSASEIAGLKLDADWVILSACNTAAAGSGGAGEALSGLARAFIYAQARALLVSHWAVASEPTVKLITAAVHAMSRNAGIGRAEALRRAMLSLIDGTDARAAHPTIWAPFVVVGEGGSGR